MHPETDAAPTVGLQRGGDDNDIYLGREGKLRVTFELGRVDGALRKPLTDYNLDAISKHSSRTRAGSTLGFFFLACPISAPAAFAFPA